MSKVLISYGLNPLSGIRLLSEGSWGQTWATLRQMLRKQKIQVSLGAMIPEKSTLLDRIRDLKFFILLEAATPTPTPLLGSPTGIQIYQQGQGSQTYKTEVVRFALGKNRIRRLPAYLDDEEAIIRRDQQDSQASTGTDLTLYR